MGQITGKVVLKETGSGIPDLLVAAYGVPEDSKPGKGAPIGGQRLGSVVTDPRGEFTISYAKSGDSRWQPKRSGPPNLVLVVALPEDPSVGPPPPPLYVSPTPRQGAAPVESFLIQLPLSLCQKAGLPLAGPGAATPQAAAVRALIDAMQKLGDGAPAEPAQPFSERYQQRRAQMARAIDAKAPKPPPIRGFHFAMPLGLSKGPALEDVSITQDAETGQIFVQVKGEPERSPLGFAGFLQARSPADPALPAPDTFLLVDAEKKSVQICLVPSPGCLRAAAERRSRLLDWYRLQRHE